jgi:peptide methionine sulfoxide reductase msrA/msrB
MTKKIWLAGGCFWGMEKYLSLLSGVVFTKVGYTNGRTENPSYDEVCHGSGHAENVEVEYDPSSISLEDLLESFCTLSIQQA